MKMCLDVNIIFHSYYATWDVNLVPAELHFNHLFGLKRLAILDSIFINSTAIFNSKKKSVEAFVIGNTTFYTEKEVNNTNLP